MSWWLYCHRPTEGGKALIRALKGKRIRPDGSRFRSSSRKKVINWGCTELPPGIVPRVLGQQPNLINHADDVERCVNKLSFFQTVSRQGLNINVPAWTNDKAVALDWIRGGCKVVARTVLNGHSGQGIVITGSANKLPDAPLYVAYIPKDEEYRIHLVASKEHVHQIYAQKKVKDRAFRGKHNRLIRCHDNGYVFQHNNVTVPGRVTQAAIEVFLKTRLDFGAVDVIYCKKDNVAYVLEINTAPGLEGHSVEVYADAFKRYF